MEAWVSIRIKRRVRDRLCYFEIGTGNPIGKSLRSISQTCKKHRQNRPLVLDQPAQLETRAISSPVVQILTRTTVIWWSNNKILTPITSKFYSIIRSNACKTSITIIWRKITNWAKIKTKVLMAAFESEFKRTCTKLATIKILHPVQFHSTCPNPASKCQWNPVRVNYNSNYRFSF